MCFAMSKRIVQYPRSMWTLIHSMVKWHLQSTLQSDAELLKSEREREHETCTNLKTNPPLREGPH